MSMQGLPLTIWWGMLLRYPGVTAWYLARALLHQIRATINPDGARLRGLRAWRKLDPERRAMFRPRVGPRLRLKVLVQLEATQGRKTRADRALDSPPAS